MRLKHIVIPLCFILIILLIAATPNPFGARYVSPWTAIPSQGTVNFSHGLTTRPLDMHVWIAHFVNTPTGKGECETEFNEVFPIYQSSLSVQTVNQNLISIRNNGAESLCVQVVARP